MDLTKYLHKEYRLDVNKTQLPINEINFDKVNEFNKIYLFCKKHYLKVDPTPSQAFPNGPYRYNFRYMVVKGNQFFELVLVCEQGCYRWLLENKKPKENTVSGRQSCIAVYKICDSLGIDLSKYECKNGFDVKKQIKKPHIECMNSAFYDKKMNHIYHMDFNSSYASRISEAIPELRPLYEKLYSKRNEDNNFYKYVLTNHIGCWQSQYCVDYKVRRRSNPYQFANLTKLAINGTRDKIDNYLEKLRKSGRTPILTNTDGIWYYSNKGPYHDKDEGNGLCQWKTDHSDCQFIMTSVGSYQFVENGIVNTVVRGKCALDNIQDRKSWEFGAIRDIKSLYTYRFDENKGVVKNG